MLSLHLTAPLEPSLMQVEYGDPFTGEWCIWVLSIISVNSWSETTSRHINLYLFLTGKQLSVKKVNSYQWERSDPEVK